MTSSKFTRWTKAYGVRKLAAALKITPAAVYQWLPPLHLTSPRADLIDAMVKLSRKKITHADIFRHIEQSRIHRANREQQAALSAALPKGEEIEICK